MDGMVPSSPSSSKASTLFSSHLTREQQGLLNFDEIVALWYFILMLWYGYFRFRDWKVITRLLTSVNSMDINTQYEFSTIHWLVVSIATMGLANFLFSVSLLEAMDHSSTIGSKVVKLSYVNMFLACLRHPCTLSLGVLAPKVAFGSDRYYYFPSQSTTGGESIKCTAMCLAALACAQIVLRMTENLMVIFRYGGGRDSETVKLADFFDFVFEAIFLVWMIKVLYKITMEISRDEYHGRRGASGQNRWQAWWKSQSLFFFWILYTVFVTVSTALVLIGMSAFLGAPAFNSEHFMYADYKAHAVNDLLLVTGIAIVLKPKLIGQSQSPFSTDSNGGDEVERGVDVDYSLLLSENHDEEENQSGDGETYEGGEINFEMTTATNTSDITSTATIGST